MTPLAFELLKDLTTPGAFRCAEGEKRDDYWHLAMHAHFFDLSAVHELSCEIAEKMKAAYDEHDVFDRRLAFLPAPISWIEKGGGTAIVFQGDTTHAKQTIIMKTPDSWFYEPAPNADFPLVHSEEKPARYGDGASSDWHFMAYAELALINSPRIIGRRQHMPHERIEREKLKSLGLVGKFPYRAWTEILLTVAPPDDRSGAPSTEAHLTGEKCLHFCRTHLRVRRGRLEYVNAHWRGNPALGIKNSRYRIVPESQP